MKTTLMMGAVLALSFGAAQAADLRVGDRLPINQLKSLSSLKVGTGVLRVLGPTTGGTLVANSLGAVGISRHDVQVSGVAPAQVRQVAEMLRLATTSVGYYDSTGLSSLRFSSLADAVDARRALKSALPADAVVSLPVDYAEIVSR